MQRSTSSPHAQKRAHPSDKQAKCPPSTLERLAALQPKGPRPIGTTDGQQAEAKTANVGNELHCTACGNDQPREAFNKRQPSKRTFSRAMSNAAGGCPWTPTVLGGHCRTCVDAKFSECKKKRRESSRGSVSPGAVGGCTCLVVGCTWNQVTCLTAPVAKGARVQAVTPTIPMLHNAANAWRAIDGIEVPVVDGPAAGEDGVILCLHYRDSATRWCYVYCPATGKEAFINDACMGETKTTRQA